jgi:hypothetical protein
VLFVFFPISNIFSTIHVFINSTTMGFVI